MQRLVGAMTGNTKSGVAIPDKRWNMIRAAKG